MKYWLLKSEPDAWSWDNQVKEGASMWDGVRNYQARNNLKTQYMPKTGVIFTPRGKRRSVTPPPPYSNGKPSLRRDDTGQEICWCGHLRSHHQGGGCSYCRSERKYGPHWYGESHLSKEKK